MVRQEAPPDAASEPPRRTAPGKPGLNYRRLLTLAVLLPVAIFLVDQCAASVWANHPGSVTVAVVLYAIFIAQVGLSGWIVGRWLDQPVLCGAVYAWLIAMVDCQALALTGGRGYRDEVGFLAYTLISAQIGMVVLWTVLGTLRWQWRLPFMLVLAVIPGYFCFPLHEDSPYWSLMRDEGWSMALLVQCAVLLAVCVFVRLMGFRLVRLPQGGTTPPPADGRAVLQFNIRDMLIWTTAAVPVLVLAKALDWASFGIFIGSGDLLPATTLAIGFAVVSLIAMWSALGSGPALVRAGVLAIATPAVGASVAWLAEAEEASSPSYRFFWLLVFAGGSWIAWTILAAGFLAAMLLMFRARGYRLARRGART